MRWRSAGGEEREHDRGKEGIERRGRGRKRDEEGKEK